MVEFDKTIKVLELDNELGEARIRYPLMSDASDLRDLICSLVDEDAEICRCEKLSLEEEIDWLSSQLKKIINNKSVALVVDIEGDVLGHGSVESKDGAMSHVGKLSIGLRKEARGYGLGDKLIKNLIKESETKLDLEIITLGVFSSNTAAKKLYEKNGFREYGRIKNGVKHNGRYKDLIRMKKDL